MKAHKDLKYYCEYCSKPFMDKQKLKYCQSTPGSIDSRVNYVKKDSTKNMYSRSTTNQTVDIRTSLASQIRLILQFSWTFMKTFALLL